MVLVLLLLTVIWAATTHYAARLLLDTDSRFRAYAEAHVSPFLGPKRGSLARSASRHTLSCCTRRDARLNLPEIEDAGMISGIK